MAEKIWVVQTDFRTALSMARATHLLKPTELPTPSDAPNQYDYETAIRAKDQAIRELLKMNDELLMDNRGLRAILAECKRRPPIYNP